MLSQMRPIRGSAMMLARALTLGNPKFDCRSFITASFQIPGNELLLTNRTSLPGSPMIAESTIESQAGSKRGIEIDKKVAMIRLRNSLSVSSRGLKLAKNRNDLVAEFYNLAKSVMDGKVDINEFLVSKTFAHLQVQVDIHIDIMNNAQIVNILSSLIKMGVNPSTSLMKLLEHEVKFRIKSLTLGQVMKLIKFYNSKEMSYEQRQMTDILNNRIRSCIYNKNSKFTDLLDILHHLNSQQVSGDYFAQIEERILNILTDNSNHEEDMVSRFLPNTVSYDYESLCTLFIELAANKRRPTPLLKAASNILVNLPHPKSTNNQASIAQLVTTLQALDSLSYPYRSLVNKLLNDLKSCIKLEDLDTVTQCNVLRMLVSLRWRAQDLLRMFFDYVGSSDLNSRQIDHNLVSTLLYATAQLNYRPEVDLKDLYRRCKIRDLEESIDKSSRKWLNYVWSLSLLDMIEESHFKSVINDTFIQGLESTNLQTGVSHSDRMKLLNLLALANLEYNMGNLKSNTLENLMKVNVSRGSDMQKYAAKIRESLNGIVNSESEMRTDVQTPFGFVVDCELNIDQNGRTLPIEESNTFASGIVNQLVEKAKTKTSNATHKCALIYVRFDETIANSSNEMLGHRQVNERILKYVGYKTVFLPQNLLSREKTSADLTNKINELIKKVTDVNKH